MKQAIFFPVYNIYSDLVKAAIGLKDVRSVEQFFREAGIKIHNIGKKKCVTCEDLLNIVTKRHNFISYESQSEFSSVIDELE